MYSEEAHALHVSDAPNGLGDVLHYSGGEHIPGLVTRDSIIEDTSDEVNRQIRGRSSIHFLPSGIYENNEYEGGRPFYKLHLFGCLMDGSKAHVIIENPPVFFDVVVPTNKSEDRFKFLIMGLLNSREIDHREVRTNTQRKLLGYEKKASRSYLRLSFDTLQQRKKALEVVQANGFSTAADDKSHYHRLVSREQRLTLTDWLILKDYNHKSAQETCQTFRLDIDSISSLNDPLEDADGRETDNVQQAYLSRDRTMIMAFDIETHTPHKGLGCPPNPLNVEDVVFMICMRIFWKDSKEPLASTCITSTPCAPDTRWTTIICNNQSSLIRAFALQFRAWSPDICTGFNDSQYDWPFLIEKAKMLGQLTWLYNRVSQIPASRGSNDESIYRFHYRKNQNVKISAERLSPASIFLIPGCVNMDTRIMFMKLYPKAEKTSLNAFLKMSALSSKLDMPHTRMWKIYETGDADKMRDIAEYCTIDAQRCQDLLIRRNIVTDRREAGILSFTSLYDCIYYADGCKVCNMIMAYAIHDECGRFACSYQNNSEKRGGKYPGAFVVDPDKGLEHELPVAGMDFVSLYPSLMMTYNFSPEKFVRTKEEAETLRNEGKSLHYTEFMYDGSLVFGWFVQHNNIEKDIGLFPRVLIELSGRRLKLKARLKVLEAQKEHAEYVLAIAKKDPSRRFADIFLHEQDRLEKEIENKPGQGALSSAELRLGEMRVFRESVARDAPIGSMFTAYQEAYKECCFRFTALDSKQKALKVFMNTFYGEAGNSISPFFLLQLAGGVTTAGQYNLKLIQEFVQNKGFTIKYGDTDSLYITCPPSLYTESGNTYNNSQKTDDDYEKFCAEKVTMTMQTMDVLRDQINDYLIDDNGSRYLRMDYEEVLFPVVFTGKKKYYGIAHIHRPNFHPKDIFIRGIDVIKQGQTGLAKEIGYRVMWDSLKLRKPGDQKTSLIDIVKKELRDAVLNKDQWSFEDFILTDAWKPEKDNKAVQIFMKRMSARHALEQTENRRLISEGKDPKRLLYTPPDPGERFRYVVVQTESLFNLRGYKVNVTRKGDKMEYEEVAKMHEKEIDTAFYLKNYVFGLCARFINEEERFQPLVPMDAVDRDKYAQDRAKLYLEQYVRALNPEKQVILQQKGYAYKRAYRDASLEISASLYDKLGEESGFPTQGDGFSYDLVLNYHEDLQERGSVVENMLNRIKHACMEQTDVTWSILECYGIDRRGYNSAQNGIPSKKSSSRLYALGAHLHRAMRRRDRANSVRARKRSLIECMQSYAESKETKLRQQMMGLLAETAEMPLKVKRWMGSRVEYYRVIEHGKYPQELGEYAKPCDLGEAVDSPISAEDKRILFQMREIWYELLQLYIYKHQHQRLVETVQKLKDQQLNKGRFLCSPNDQEIQIAIRNGPPPKSLIY